MTELDRLLFGIRPAVDWWKLGLNVRDGLPIDTASSLYILHYYFDKQSNKNTAAECQRLTTRCTGTQSNSTD
jgi:hypothetical protein